MAGLKCEVGVGTNETEIMECEGSWDTMKMMMKEKLGDKWDQVEKNLTSSMTSMIENMKKQANKIQEIIGNTLNPADDGIKKREAGEDAEAEPEPEPEDSEDYYCIKNSLAGATLKSCLPKVGHIIAKTTYPVNLCAVHR